MDQHQLEFNHFLTLLTEIFIADTSSSVDFKLKQFLFSDEELRQVPSYYFGLIREQKSVDG